LADATGLPFEDSCFDYASVSFGLHDKKGEARDKVISEMKRVVRKKGALVLIDFEVPLPKNPYSFLAKAIEFLVGGAH
jgi:ubiquinone/menaquinone biosynthesis C-methylase UbiE